MSRLLLVLSVVFLCVPARAQVDDFRKVKSVDGPECGDGMVPEYVLPGHFKEALARARELNRCLLVKGVAFGVDELGAKCPTRGHW